MIQKGGKYLVIGQTSAETIPVAPGIFTGKGITVIGSVSAAIPHFEKFLTKNPNSVDGLFNISECYYHLGHIDSAVIGYRQILRLNPEFLPAKNRLRAIETAKTPV